MRKLIDRICIRWLECRVDEWIIDKELNGYTVDTHGSTPFAYKGPRFAPTVTALCPIRIQYR